jgi:hypothetical protein
LAILGATIPQGSVLGSKISKRGEVVMTMKVLVAVGSAVVSFRAPDGADTRLGS